MPLHRYAEELRLWVEPDHELITTWGGVELAARLVHVLGPAEDRTDGEMQGAWHDLTTAIDAWFAPARRAMGR